MSRISLGSDVAVLGYVVDLYLRPSAALSSIHGQVAPKDAAVAASFPPLSVLLAGLLVPVALLHDLVHPLPKVREADKRTQ